MTSEGACRVAAKELREQYFGTTWNFFESAQKGCIQCKDCENERDGIMHVSTGVFWNPLGLDEQGTKKARSICFPGREP